MANSNNSELEYPTEATAGDQRLRSFEVQSEESLAQSLCSADLHLHISKVPYEIYLRRGKVHGHDLDDWFAAERIILFQLSQKKTQAGEEQFEMNSRISQSEQIERQTAFSSH
jgi:DUF2934 family protein